MLAVGKAAGAVIEEVGRGDFKYLLILMDLTTGFSDTYTFVIL